MVDGAFYCCRAAVEHLAASDGARILNIASIESLRGKPGSLAYGTAKGALVNMTRELACELAPRGINVNAIAPGFVDTPLSIMPGGTHEHEMPLFRDVYIGRGFIPLRRDGKPVDIAGPAAFLCGPDSAYVTGQILRRRWRAFGNVLKRIAIIWLETIHPTGLHRLSDPISSRSALTGKLRLGQAGEPGLDGEQAAGERSGGELRVTKAGCGGGDVECRQVRPAEHAACNAGRRQ